MELKCWKNLSWRGFEPPSFRLTVQSIKYLAITQPKYCKNLRSYIIFCSLPPWCSLRVSNVICSGMFCDAVITMHVVPYLKKVFIVSLASGGRKLLLKWNCRFPVCTECTHDSWIYSDPLELVVGMSILLQCHLTYSNDFFSAIVIMPKASIDVNLNEIVVKFIIHWWNEVEIWCQRN